MKPEYESLLAGLPLLSAAEQAEFFEAARALQVKQTADALNVLQAGASSAPVDKRVARYVALRDARAAANKEADTVDRAYKSALEAIETSLIAAAQEQGVTGFKTEAGTTYLEAAMHASIADDTAFFDFVREQGDLDFFERRLKIAHIKEWSEANEGAMPPGLNIFREMKMKVRRT